MKVIIAGSRNLHTNVNYPISLSQFEITEVVSGGAKGIDKSGEQWAINSGIPVKQFLADWDKHGKSAGMIRNAEMARYADALIAVWDGRSRGTLNMMNRMHAHANPIFVYCPT